MRCQGVQGGPSVAASKHCASPYAREGAGNGSIWPLQRQLLLDSGSPASRLFCRTNAKLLWPFAIVGSFVFR